MAIQNLYPTIKPSLNLDFANTKTLDPRITFSRASAGTFYDGKTVAKAEENLLTYSQEFDILSWSRVGTTVTANSTSAPDGTSTADTLTEDTSTSRHDIQLISNISISVSGAAYTASVFAKASGRDFLQITLPGASHGTSQYANFNLLTGAVGNSTGGTASIVNAGSGWYRCIFTATATSTTNAGPVLAVIDADTASRLPSYTGDGTSGIYLWGAQLEQRSAVTAYTPTTSQPITNYIPVLQTAAANVARFDHDPVAGESLGLLIEESRTNLMLNSSILTGANLTGGTREGNQLVAPDGSVTASIFRGAGSGISTWTQTVTATASKMTYSIFVKTGLPSSRTSFSFLMRNTTTAVNFTTGVFSSVTGNITGAGWSSTHVGNGWYRIAYTNSDSQIISAGDLVTCYFGANGSSAFATSDRLGLWGAQLEAGAFPTSYIKTEASQVTRADDVAVMTGGNFSSWYRADEGTLFASWQKEVGSVNVPASISRDLNNYLFGASADATSVRSFVRVNNVSEATLSVSGSPNSIAYAVAYARNDAAMSVNGSAVVTDTSCQIPQNMNKLQIGETVFTVPRRQHIRKIAYYPLRLTNAQLQALTT